MKILHCIPNMAGGGAERQLTYLVKSQRELGLDVHVCLCGGGSNMERLQATGGSVHLLGLRNNHDPFLLLKLVKLVRKLQPDIVQTWLLQMDVVGGLAALLTRVPFILSERSSAGCYPITFKWFLRKVVGRHSSAIIANSAEGLDYWKPILKKHHPCFVIPNSIPIEEINAALPFNPQCAGLSESAPRVLFVGRLHPDKRIDLLLDVFKLALERTAAILLICGQGKELHSLQNRVAADKQLASRVFFLSYQSNIWGLMKTSDVFVSFSSYEGCPNAVIEAAVCGLPLLLSDIPGHRDVVDEHAIYTSGDLDADAEKLLEILNFSKQSHARDTFTVSEFNKFNLQEIALHYKQCYLTVMASSKCKSKGNRL